MKKTKSPIALTIVVVVLACVLSCNEQDERMETKNTSIVHVKNKKVADGRVAPNFDGSEGDPLDLTTARKWTANYRNNSRNPNEVQSHYFGYEIIQQILNQSDCVGIRIYYALDERGEKKLLLIGVGSNGENLIPAPGGKVGDGGNTVADYSYPCPSYCPGSGL